MACATATRPETSNWTESFPLEVNSLRSSSMFMKKLMAVAVSNITYLRAMFPEFAYGVRKLGDLDLKILSENSAYGPACQVIDWVKGCFEALDYKYLRQMMLGIHDKPDDHDNVIETYIFRFSYANGLSVSCNGVEISSSLEHDMQMTRKATVTLLRTLIIITQTLEPLPPNYYVTMKLLYYDDVTPPDYEPKGFIPAATEGFFFSGNPLTVRVGHVSTPYHSLKFDVKADKKEFEFPEEESMPSGSIQLQSSGKTENSVNFFLGEIDSLDNLVDIKDAPGDTEAESPLGCSSKYSNMVKDAKAAKAEENGTVRCPCKNQEEDGVMIQCLKCESWQHGVCFGMLKEVDAPEIYLCDQCYKSDNSCGFEPKDTNFYELPALSMQAICVWRRALLCVSDMKTVTCTSLAKILCVSKGVAANIITKMEEEEYLTTGSGKSRGKKCVNQTLIKKYGIPKYILGTANGIITDDQDVAAEELNEVTNNLCVSSDPEITKHGLSGHGKENNQVEVKGSSQPYGVSDPSVLSELRGKKRAIDLHQVEVKGSSQPYGVSDPSVFSELRGKKRAIEIHQVSLSQDPGYDLEQVRKRIKASTCKSGVACTNI